MFWKLEQKGSFFLYSLRRFCGLKITNLSCLSKQARHCTEKKKKIISYSEPPAKTVSLIKLVENMQIFAKLNLGLLLTKKKKTKDQILHILVNSTYECKTGQNAA